MNLHGLTLAMTNSNGALEKVKMFLTHLKYVKATGGCIDTIP